MRVHPQNEMVFGGFMAFTLDKIPEVIKINKKFMDNSSPDMALLVGIGAPETQVLCHLFLVIDNRRW